jgi:hypothetical protein
VAEVRSDAAVTIPPGPPDPRKMACDELYDLYFEGRDDEKLARVEPILFG